MNDTKLARSLRAQARRNFAKRRLGLLRGLLVICPLVGGAVMVSGLLGFGRYGAYTCIFLAVIVSNLIVGKLEEPQVRLELESILFKLGRCKYCGYDLQGSSSERCPECGTSIDISSTEAGNS